MLANWAGCNTPGGGYRSTVDGPARDAYMARTLPADFPDTRVAMEELKNS